VIAHGIKRGSAELAVLSVLADGPSHGYELARRIEDETGGALRFTLASLYPLLYKLEAAGLVKGEWRSSRGRRRRHYLLTPKGRARLRPLLDEWKTFLAAIQRLTALADA
jgi:PadR family transcriptional regulator PadR